VNKGEGRGLCVAQALCRLPQLQGGDLVRLHHRVPGISLGCDRDAKRLAALDDLALGYDTIVRDLGDVALGGLGEPDCAVGRRCDKRLSLLKSVIQISLSCTARSPASASESAIWTGSKISPSVIMRPRMGSFDIFIGGSLPCFLVVSAS
jgi:hypothetical protein